MKMTRRTMSEFLTQQRGMRGRFRLMNLKGNFGRKQGFGLNEVIGIAAGIIIAVVVVIPGLQGFAGDILGNLTDWWNDMASSVFATP
ncbi:MAG TPA: hypothetical protein DD640_08855 [Clostridiales bacterium]|nr:hypothetical protein [Clostridiales bacterium]